MTQNHMKNQWIIDSLSSNISRQEEEEEEECIWDAIREDMTTSATSSTDCDDPNVKIYIFMILIQKFVFLIDI